MTRLTALFAVFVLLLAACGGDDDDAASSDPDPTATAAPAAAPDEPDDPDDAGDTAPEATAEPEPAADGPAPRAFSASDDIDGLRIYEIDYSTEAIHLGGEIAYGDAVPTGGAHSPLWQFCGYYTVEVPEERALHSMEHGAIWIAHQPGVDLSSWADRSNEETHLLVAPGSGLDSPIVVSAWGAQIDADSPDDPRIEAFIEMFIRQGPEAAPCTGGGVGQPPEELGPPLDV